MSDDKDKKPEEEEERTVFMPSGSGTVPPAGADPEPDEPSRSLSDPEPSSPDPETGEVAPEPEPAADAEPSEPVTPAPEPPAPEPVAEAAPPAFEPPADATPPAPEPPADAAPPTFEPAPPGPADAAPPTFEPAPPEPADAAPPTFEPAPPEPAAVAPPPAAEPPAAPAPTGATAAPTTIVPVEGARPIKVGDVLNHIFEVKRFLARGGMGEVFEGCNINTDERVAIKVMLPAMAADEKVVAMFRKEARTLTKLQHEALVSYRVLAQEPTLGALYIVTEFIEGVELADMLGKVERTPEELAGLLKRLASGLSAAHRLGAVHRDMSPDNVLLPGGDVHQAKIIDFGIAKDLDASSATIVGDGFAGKLNYVAPEQLGDYGREVGPWSDVYSLALVILAVAQGKNVNMSGSLVDAIDKRRKGPDMSAAPASLRPLLEAMLRPDPKERMRSMDEVLAALSGGAVSSAPPPPPPPPSPTPGVTQPVGASGGPNKALLLGGVVAVALAAAGGAWYAFGDMVGPGGGGDSNEVVQNDVAPPGDPVATARNAINSVLPSTPCTWLDIASVENGSGGVSVALRGVAGDAAAAQQELNQALTGAGLANARLDFGDVAPITPAGCAALDTYRQVRASSDYHLSVAQPRFEMMMQPPGMPYAGEQASNAVINFNFANAEGDFAILGIEPSGAISNLLADRASFDQALTVQGSPIVDEGDGRYKLKIDLDHQGWSGIILISGRGPFGRDLVAPQIGARGPSWQNEFLSAAAAGQWKVEMVWFESVNRESGDTAPPPAPPGAPTPPADGQGGPDKPPE